MSSDEGSSLPPLPPSNIPVDPSSIEYNSSSDTGFVSAPSSPPATPPQCSFPADSSAQISSPPLTPLLAVTTQQVPPAEATKRSGPLPAILHGRDALPSHHLLKVASFSSLSKASIEKSSSEFEAGGYKWNFSIYPTGDKTKDGQGHISLYLEIVDTISLPAGWEVNTIFNFFVFDQLRDKYVGPQDGTVRRFHCMKTQWGVVKFMDLETFKNRYNGYLVNDTCSFGVEVFVVKSTSKAEHLSIINNPPTHQTRWNFFRVSKGTLHYETDSFTGGDYKWRILFYPDGYQLQGNRINNIISVYLQLDTSTLASGTKLLVQYTLRLENKKKGKHFERNDEKLFSSASKSGGFRQFMSLTKFKDPENGFVVDDNCSIEADFKVLGLITLE